MAYIALTDSEIAPDKPVSNDLLQKVKDNFDDHEARISAGSGGGSSGGIGEVLNGSLESDSDANGIPDNFTRYHYGGGSSARDLAEAVHGKYAYKFVHPGGSGNGGGYLETDYISVSQLFIPSLPFAYRCSVAGIKVRVDVRYYAADANGSPSTFLGEQTLWTNTANPIRWYGVELTNPTFPYTTARYVKYRFIGGYYDTNVAGSVWFDAIGAELVRGKTRLTNTVTQAALTFYPSGWASIGSIFTITLPDARLHRWLAMAGEGLGGFTPGWDGGAEIHHPMSWRARVFQSSGTPFALYGTTVTVPTYAWAGGYSYVDISSLAAGTYRLQFEASGTGGSYYPGFRSLDANAHFFGIGKYSYDVFSGVTTESYG